MEGIAEFADVRDVHKSRIPEHLKNQNELVDFPSWEKLDLRVAEIKAIEDIEGADKLYKLTIDVGELGERVICAGIKKYYEKEELKGKRCILFVNLAPRMMKGIESKGMILAAVNDDESNVVLIQPEQDIEVGSRVR